jgi:hypothetical protein
VQTGDVGARRNQVGVAFCHERLLHAIEFQSAELLVESFGHDLVARLHA